MNEVAVLAAGAFFVLVLVATMMRLGLGQGGRTWGLGWIALYVSGLGVLLADRIPAIAFLVPLCGTAFAALTWVGAASFAGRQLPRWAGPAILTVLALRMGLWLGAEDPAASQLAGAGVIALASLLAMREVLSLARSSGGRTLDWLLAFAFPALGGAALFYVWWMLQDATGHGFFLWLVCGVFVAGLQTMALMSRVARVEQARRLALHSLLDAIPIGVALADETSCLRIANRGVSRFVRDGSLRPWIGTPIAELGRELAMQSAEDVGPGLGPVFELGAGEQHGEVVLRDGRHVATDGFPIEGADRTTGRLMLLRDVTAERDMQEQLARTGRLETLGRLAGGIAHDFNNKLTTVLGNVAMLREDLPRGPGTDQKLDDLESAAAYCAELTRDLLDFASRGAQHAESVDLEKWLSGLRERWVHRLPEGVRLDLRLAPDVGRLTADPGRLERALEQLLVNASEAVAPGGRIQLSARRFGSEPDATVEIAVSDDGHGIDEALRPQVFDPFFTTKRHEGGEASGLGLAIVHGIVTAHGGEIQIGPATGGGTRVVTHWPVG